MIQAVALAVAVLAPARVERSVALMGTTLRLAVEAADRDHGLAASEVAVRALERAEARLSTWRADGELERLNRTPAGQPVAVSPELRRELRAAAACSVETGGAFEPGVGPLVAAWGLRGGGRLPSDAEIAVARRSGGIADLRWHGDRAIRSRPGLRLEEGGFGKGAGLDAALAALAADGRARRATLDLGGQVALYGSGEVWLAVADPDQRSRAAIALRVDAGSISTSGNSEHGFVVDGRRYGHILDPRSGRPAPDFGSVTVWAATALRADCLSTGLYVMGPDRALAWVERHPDVGVLVLERDAHGWRARVGGTLGGRVRALAAAVRVE